MDVIDYISKHSDDSASLIDATKYKLEVFLRGDT